jgi:hypothetical protein
MYGSPPAWPIEAATLAELNAVRCACSGWEQALLFVLADSLLDLGGHFCVG